LRSPAEPSGKPAPLTIAADGAYWFRIPPMARFVRFGCRRAAPVRHFVGQGTG
jgi:hypothetical protein